MHFYQIFYYQNKRLLLLQENIKNRQKLRDVNAQREERKKEKKERSNLFALPVLSMHSLRNTDFFPTHADDEAKGITATMYSSFETV